MSAALVSRTLVIVPTYAAVRRWQLRYLRLRSVLSPQSTER